MALEHDILVFEGDYAGPEVCSPAPGSHLPTAQGLLKVSASPGSNKRWPVHSRSFARASRYVCSGKPGCSEPSTSPVLAFIDNQYWQRFYARLSA